MLVKSGTSQLQDLTSSIDALVPRVSLEQVRTRQLDSQGLTVYWIYLPSLAAQQFASSVPLCKIRNYIMCRPTEGKCSGAVYVHCIAPWSRPLLRPRNELHKTFDSINTRDRYCMCEHRTRPKRLKSNGAD